MARHDNGDLKPEAVADAVTDLKLERNGSAEDVKLDGIPSVTSPEAPPNGLKAASRRSSQDSKSASRSHSQSPVKDAEEQEQKLGGDITVKLEPGKPPKLARTSSQKIIPRTPPLYDHLPDCTAEATSKFQLMDECTYANKYMGYTEHGMDCDCAEDWGK
jgi:histone-lysine N-methyltransferase SETD2